MLEGRAVATVNGYRAELSSAIHTFPYKCAAYLHCDT